MSETKLLKDLARKIGKTDHDSLLKLKQIYNLLEKRTMKERLKMGKDAIQAYAGR